MQNKNYISKDSQISLLSFLSDKNIEAFRKMDIETFEDLLFLRPRLYENRKDIVEFSSVQDRGIVNTFAQIISKSKSQSGVWRFTLKDLMDDFDNPFKNNTADVWCFGKEFLSHIFSEGDICYIYGSASRKFGYANNLLISSSFTISKAIHTNTGYNAQLFGKIIPIYSQDRKLSSVIHRAKSEALIEVDFSDNFFSVDKQLLDKFNLDSVYDALKFLHCPKTMEEVERARRTLALFEFLQYRKLSVDEKNDEPLKKIELSKDEKEFIFSLPFTISESQENAIADCVSDLECRKRTERLLQGDVGSGKTIVAFIASYHEALKKNQSCIIAPTEILSYQHFLNAKKYFKDFNIRIEYMSSASGGKKREKILAELENGKIDLLIGTQAILYSDVVFKNLTLAVVDEEQRFGIRQKRLLLSKGSCVKIVYMSATPIPLSIVKVFFSQISISFIQKPDIARPEVKTYLVSQKKRLEAYNLIKSELLKGHCAYFVSPRIDDEDEMELKSIEKILNDTKSIFKDIPYEVITSKTSSKKKTEILEKFLKGGISYIVSTSVVEVGMDNPLATVMVIEDADVFGLSTLHQLRGRVGRSGLQSWCFLIFRDDITESGKERLKILKKSQDGFEIAQTDLKLRGGGEFFGLKQSGRENLKYLDLGKDGDFLELS